MEGELGPGGVWGTKRAGQYPDEGRGREEQVQVGGSPALFHLGTPAPQVPGLTADP